MIIFTVKMNEYYSKRAHFCLWLFLGINQYWAGWVLCPGGPEGSTGSGSGLKYLGRQGHSLKSPLDKRQVVYPLHQGSSQLTSVQMES